MIKILNESLQDVDSFLKNDIKELLSEQFPSISKNPEDIGEIEINEFIVNRVVDEFPDEMRPELVQVVVIKVLREETEIVSGDHQVIKFNGYLYDYTAHQFTEEYNNLLTFGQIPVIQTVIKDDSQVNDGVSTVKSYALVEY